MITTSDLLKQLKAKQQGAPSICSNCQQVFTFKTVGYATRPADMDGIEEVGIKCPSCGHWYHVYFLNDELREGKPPANASRKERRAYKREFDKFQKAARKKAGLRKVNGRWSLELKQ